VEQAGTIPTVGWYHFRDNKIDSVRAYFDPRPMAERWSPPDQQRPPTPFDAVDIPQFASSLQVCAEMY